MILGQPYDIKEEGENYEFKEFCLDKIPSNYYFTEEEVINIIKNGKFIPKLNKLVSKNLFEYLKKYIPKYYTAFCNSNLKGNLLFGISDVAEITGIPYYGNLSESIIKKYIINKILPIIKGEKSIEDFNIIIKKVKKNKSFLTDNSDDLLNNYLKSKNIRKKIFDNYNSDYKKWHNLLDKKSGKLIDILNDHEEKNNLIEYIKTNNGNESIIKYLKENDFTSDDIPRGNNIKLRKTDPNDFIYWLTNYKDILVKSIQIQKPEKPYHRLSTDPFIILDKLSDLRYKFIDNNNKLNYYFIIIQINGIDKNNPMYYYNSSKPKELVFKQRIGSMCV